MGRHEAYIRINNLKALKKVNRLIGVNAHNIQKELLFSINKIVKKYVDERKQNMKASVLARTEKNNDDIIQRKFDKSCLDHDLGSADLPQMPNNINTETAKERGGLPAQQIVSTSPGTNQKDVHAAFFNEKSDCKIKWSEQKRDKGFRCTFCWRLNCGEKGDNPTKAHSQRFDRPDTVTYAYWICKKFGLTEILDYNHILKLIHRPIGILKLAGQCHPVYDSLGYPVKIFYSPGFWEESSQLLDAYEIPDRSFMWVKDLDWNPEKHGSWGIYTDARNNLKKKIAMRNDNSRSSISDKKTMYDFGIPTSGKFTDMLFTTAQSTTPPPVIIPFQDYALTGMGRIYDKWKNITNRTTPKDKIKNFYLFCCGFYIYLYQLNNDMKGDYEKMDDDDKLLAYHIKATEEVNGIDVYSELTYMMNDRETLYEQCKLKINPQSDQKILNI